MAACKRSARRELRRTRWRDVCHAYLSEYLTVGGEAQSKLVDEFHINNELCSWRSYCLNDCIQRRANVGVSGFNHRCAGQMRLLSKKLAKSLAALALLAAAGTASAGIVSVISDDFEGDLSKWTGKNMGGHSGIIVATRSILRIMY